MIKTLYPEQLNGLHNWFLCRRADDEHTWVEESFITEKQAKRAVWLKNGKERMNGRPEVFYCERIAAEGRTIVAVTKGPEG